MSDSVNNIRANVYINEKQAGQSLRALEGQARKVRNELMGMSRNADGFGAKKAQFQKVTTEIRKQKTELYGVNKGWGSAGAGFGKYLGALTAGFATITGVFMGIKKLIGDSANLSDVRADVAKTTQLTNSELEKLESKYRSFNTRTPREELHKLATEAGKMGIRGVDNIAKFVEQANQLNVALGDDLGEGATLKVAKMADVFDVEMKNIGSSINAVADNTKANAGFLTEFLSRLGGIGKQAKISAGDILGYGTVMDEMGLKTEMSSTALNGFFIDFIKNTEKFGDAAGFQRGELSKLIGEKGTNEGFLAFLERLKETSKGSDDFLRKLEQVGISGDRGSQVFLALSQNVDKLRDRQGLANRELEKGTSLTEEYAKKNGNLAGNLEKVQKHLLEAFVNSSVVNGISEISGWMAKMVEVPVSETVEKERIELRMLELQLYDTNTPAEDRVKIIDDLKTRYPGYLSHIDSEKVTNEELSVALAQVNQQLLNKIIIQKQDEKLTETLTKQADYEMGRMESRSKVQELLIKMSEKYGFTIDKNRDIIEQAEEAAEKYRSTTSKLFGGSAMDAELSRFKGWQKFSNEQAEEANSLAEQRQKIIKELGLDMQEIDKKLDGGGNKKTGNEDEKDLLSGDPTGDSVNKRAAAQEKIRAFLVKASGDEEEVIREKYQKLIDLAEKYSVEDLPALMAAMNAEVFEELKKGYVKEGEEQAKAEKDRLAKSKELLEKQKQLREKYGLISQEEELTMQLDMLKEYYDEELLNYDEYIQAKSFMEDKHREDQADKDDEARIRRLQDQREEYQIALQIANGFSDLVSAFKDSELAKTEEITRKKGESEKEYTKRKEEAEKTRNDIVKKYAVIEAIIKVSQIIASTAVAVMSALELGFPVGPIVAGLYAATGALQVGNAMAEVDKIKSMHTGGFTGGTGLGLVDPNIPGRSIKGYVHDNEYVVATEELRRPDIAQMVGQIEMARSARMGSFAGGGFTSGNKTINNNSTQTINVDELVNTVNRLSRVLDSMVENGIPAVADDEFARNMKIKTDRDQEIQEKSRIYAN